MTSGHSSHSGRRDASLALLPSDAATRHPTPSMEQLQAGGAAPSCTAMKYTSLTYSPGTGGGFDLQRTPLAWAPGHPLVRAVNASVQVVAIRCSSVSKF